MSHSQTPPTSIKIVDILWILAAPTVLFTVGGLVLVLGVLEPDPRGWVGAGLVLGALILLWQWSRPRSSRVLVEVLRALFLSLPAMSIPGVVLQGGLPVGSALEDVMLVPPWLGGLFAVFALVFVFVLKVRLSRPQERWVSQIERW